MLLTKSNTTLTSTFQRNKQKCNNRFFVQQKPKQKIIRSQTRSSRLNVVNDVNSDIEVPKKLMEYYTIETQKTQYKCIHSICVVGASGDLAKKKIFPALFALYLENSLPKHFMIYGFSRTKMTNEEFRKSISSYLTCRVFVNDTKTCEEKMDQFLSRCHYQYGDYDSKTDYIRLNTIMNKKEHKYEEANRVYFFSVPSTLFRVVAHNSIKYACSQKGYNRVVVEKPFGRDSESSRILSNELLEVMKEDDIYRIDHYLGKELIDNLTVLRFSNIVFQPLWSRQYIKNVQILFSEPFGTEGRGKYFDNYGIIRDIMQNHLLQMMALFAMEPPISLNAEDIRNEKVKVLRSIRVPTVHDLVVGQYKSYVDDPTIPNDSLCPTFGALALFIDNPRWDGVPFMMKAGKALDKRIAEIRVQFHNVPAQLYSQSKNEQLRNELVIRIQPDESIYLKINNKIPGLDMRLDNSQLDLTYKNKYNKDVPDAYERLLLDVINGDKRLFIRGDELEASWDIFTPLLYELEEKQILPERYPYGSRGPIGAHYLAGKYDVKWGDL